MYDYTIIGAGPCGLTLALYLGRLNKKVLLIEKEQNIGGCHRVRRVNGLFTEHGPRVYSSNYLAFIDLIKLFGQSFDDMFVKYDYGVTIDIVASLHWNEILAIVYEFFKFMINEDQARKITMKEFTEKYNYTPESIIYIDNLCRLGDGGTLNNFTLFEFLQTFNQNYFYNLYHPKIPTDVGLFQFWQESIKNTGNVTIMFDTEISTIINNNSNKIQHIVTTDKKIIESRNYIFAIPPQPMISIVERSTNPDMFGPFNELQKWAVLSNYQIYIPVIFHWSTQVPIRKIWGGYTDTDYSLVYIIMSNYIDFRDPRSKTVITCSVRRSDRKSQYTNKTANECTETELIEEVFRQLKEKHQPDLPQPDYSLLSPGVYKQDDVWLSNDTAYFYTRVGHRGYKSVYDNLYWVGTHNGNSDYSFTSMETAIENSIRLLYELEPETKNTIMIHKMTTVKQVTGIIFLIILLVLMYLFLL